jgi:mono/diheme cytochrome c family protein
MKIFAIVMLAAAPSVVVPVFRPAVVEAFGPAVAAQAPLTAPSGDAKRGKTLFDQTYRCYACHGYAGETGAPRLVPMARTEDSFTEFVRKPRVPAMPAFADVPAKDLADVYAYLRSLRSTAPAADSIPLLRDILQQIR